MSCINCHLNAGQRDRALPLVGVAGMFPEYNNRAARLISLPDRIVDCFLRSENGTAHDASQHPTTASKEVLAVAAYVTWLSRGYAVGANPAWRNKNTIPADKLIPVDKIDVGKGEAIYAERCTSCHGADGQGVQIGDKKAGPLWGPDSWNDGAGAGRVYTLAGIVRYTMPYLNPGSLTDEEAQEVAAFINSKPRPKYPVQGTRLRRLEDSGRRRLLPRRRVRHQQSRHQSSAIRHQSVTRPMKRAHVVALVAAGVLLIASVGAAQFQRRGGRFGYGQIRENPRLRRRLPVLPDHVPQRLGRRRRRLGRRLSARRPEPLLPLLGADHDVGERRRRRQLQHMR